MHAIVYLKLSLIFNFSLNTASMLFYLYFSGFVLGMVVGLVAES